jgi:hypothetical protein
VPDGEAQGAEPSAQSETRRAAARDAFRLGAALARQGQWTEALAAFERSGSLLPHATTTYNIGFCERALGRNTRARKAFRSALEQGRRAAQELDADVRAQAEAYLTEVEQRLARVTVHAREAELGIAVDGRPLELEAPGPRPVAVAGTLGEGEGKPIPAPSFVILIDPGSHVFEITSGKRTRMIRKTLTPGSSVVLELELPGERPTTGTGVDARWNPTWAIIAYGVGAAGMAVGAVAGLAALNEKSALDENCSLGKDRCDPRYQNDIDAMNRDATISSVGFGVGLVGIGVGTVLLLTRSDGRGEQHPDGTARSFRPWIGLGAAGLDATF